MIATIPACGVRSAIPIRKHPPKTAGYLGLSLAAQLAGDGAPGGISAYAA